MMGHPRRRPRAVHVVVADRWRAGPPGRAPAANRPQLHAPALIGSARSPDSADGSKLPRIQPPASVFDRHPARPMAVLPAGPNSSAPCSPFPLQPPVLRPF